MESTEEQIARHLEWLTARRMSARTRQSRLRALILIERQLETELMAATPAQLLDWAAAAAQRLAPETTAGYVSHLRGFYRWADRLDLVSALPVPKRPRRIPRPISNRDLATVVLTAPARIRPWLVLAAWAGLRAQEISRQRREDLADRASPRVIVVTAYAAKGGRERIVPMSDFVAGELGRSGWLAGRTGWCSPLLDGRSGHIPAWLVSKLAGEHLHDCGIPMSLHNLRHWFGTSSWRESRDLRLVQEWMGHADPKTTAGYTAWDRPGAVDIINALPTPLTM